MPRFVRPSRVLGRCLALAAAAVVSAVLLLPPIPAQSLSSAVTRLDWGVRAPMPTARADYAVAVALNGKVYAAGGDGGPGSRYLTTVEEYDPATDAWITK